MTCLRLFCRFTDLMSFLLCGCGQTKEWLHCSGWGAAQLPCRAYALPFQCDKMPQPLRISHNHAGTTIMYSCVICWSGHVNSACDKTGQWQLVLGLYDQLKADMVKVGLAKASTAAPSTRPSDLGVEPESSEVLDQSAKPRGEGTELPPPRVTVAALTACARWVFLEEKRREGDETRREEKAEGFTDSCCVRYRRTEHYTCTPQKARSLGAACSMGVSQAVCQLSVLHATPFSLWALSHQE